MLKCILADRLYVPEEHVTQDILDKFVYQLGDDESGYDYGPFSCGINNIRTFNKMGLNGNIYYGFSRGNIPKLGEMFGHLPWDDRTSAKPMVSDLQFKGTLHTWETKKIGQQEAVDKWLRHKSGIIKAPPRFGKTISSIYVITKLKLKTVIVAHQIDLLDQFYKSFVNFTNATEIQEVKPRQNKRDASGRIFGHFSDYDNPEELDVCFLCWQTFASIYGEERIREYASAWGLVIVDECHSYDTPVLIDYDKYMSIGEIYENPQITHVLSYNLETKSIEKKKILERRCRETESRKRISIIVNGEKGKAIISPTENHKYYVVGKGYTPASDLSVGDKLITYDGKLYKAKCCTEPECNEIFVAPTENPESISGYIMHHMASQHSAATFTTLKKCPFCDFTGYSLSGHLLSHDDDKRKNKSEKNRQFMLNFAQTDMGMKYRQQASERMKVSNPSYDTDLRQKITSAVSKTFWNKSKKEREEQVTRFQNAPKRIASPTKKEKEVIDCNIPNLVFTGNGKYYLDLEINGQRRLKNPDFIYVPNEENFDSNFKATKVIELMDYEYWHSQEENDPLKLSYAAAGVDCLILDSKLRLDDIRAKIEAFIHNHYITIEDVKIKYIKKDKRVYNLEVEDNHNYFVVAKGYNEKFDRPTYKPTTPILVSNCHRTGGLVYAKTVNRLQARYRLGLTGTVERTDGREFLLKDVIGPVIAEGRVHTIPCKVEIIHTGCKIPYNFSEPLPYLYKRIYKANGRMDLVLDYLEKDVKEGRYICFAFHRCSIVQLKGWTDILKANDIKAEAFYGSCYDREGVLERARNGETQVLVCNSQMLTGIDVPRWDTYYCAFPSSNVVFNDKGDLSGNFYQEFSRIRTPFTYENGKQKELGLIRDFIDNNSFCYGSYKKRYKAYQSQGFKINVTKAEVVIEKATLD